MDWRAVTHPTLHIPVNPAPEQLVLAYCASMNTFAVGYCRGGHWQIQPPPGGVITHWAPLTPPPDPAAKQPTARYSLPPPPEMSKKR